jgi:hypothetical protein
MTVRERLPHDNPLNLMGWKLVIAPGIVAAVAIITHSGVGRGEFCSAWLALSACSGWARTLMRPARRPPRRARGGA